MAASRQAHLIPLGKPTPGSPKLREPVGREDGQFPVKRGYCVERAEQLKPLRHRISFEKGMSPAGFEPTAPGLGIRQHGYATVIQGIQEPYNLLILQVPFSPRFSTLSRGLPSCDCYMIAENPT